MKKMTTKQSSQSTVNGHGYFRKSKAYGLVCGVVLATAFFGASVSADEVTVTQDTATSQLVSTIQENTTEQLAENVTSETSVTSQNPSQEANDQAYNDLQDVIDQNNGLVDDAEDKYGDDVTVSTDDSTTTDGSAGANEAAQDHAEDIYQQNQDALNKYEQEKADYDAIVEQADKLNQAVSQAESDLTSKGVTVTIVTTVVNSVEELNALMAQNAAAIASANKQVTLHQAIMSAFEGAQDAHDKLEDQISGAQGSHGGDVTVDKVDIPTGDGTENGYQDYTSSIEELIAKNNQAIEEFLKALEAFNNSTNVTVSGTVATENVDNSQFGNSFMNGSVQADGSFTFTHDMNDGDNDWAGILGTGTLSGKLHYTVTSNGDGSITVHITGIELYSYSYTSNRPNHGVNQNINFHVYSLDGTEIYSVYHNGNSSFVDMINRLIALDLTYRLEPGRSTGEIGFLKIDDNWIYNTHGQAIFSFTNPNQRPHLVLQSADAPTPPELEDITVSLTSAEYPEKPTLSLTRLSNAVNEQLPEVPEVPEAPQVVKSSVLPMTGDETSTASILASIAGVFMTLVGLVGVRKRKEN